MKLTDFGTKGADLGNIFYLRDVVDADGIVEGIAKAKKAGNKVSNSFRRLNIRPFRRRNCVDKKKHAMLDMAKTSGYFCHFGPNCPWFLGLAENILQPKLPGFVKVAEMPLPLDAVLDNCRS